MPTIVMTGGTSGLGLVAARIFGTSGARVLLGARRPGPPGTEVLPLELARLDSVRQFAAAVEERLDGNGIDALVLNAGVQYPHDRARTADGYEATFGINHLAHFLLAQLLLPRLAPEAAVVLTSSSTHDVTHKRIVPGPRHADAFLLAHPERDPDRDPKPQDAGGRAYTASKLCNVMTARALGLRPDLVDRGVRSLAYDPGATPGTGIARTSPLPIRVLWKLAGSPVGRLIPGVHSAEQAGSHLAALAMREIRPPEGRYYASLVKGRLTWPAAAATADDDNAVKRLWDDSSTLVSMAAADEAQHGS